MVVLAGVGVGVEVGVGVGVAYTPTIIPWDPQTITRC